MLNLDNMRAKQGVLVTWACTRAPSVAVISPQVAPVNEILGLPFHKMDHTRNSCLDTIVGVVRIGKKCMVLSALSGEITVIERSRWGWGLAF